MPNVLVSVRLSPRLAAMVDRAVGQLECSPSSLVEALLERSETRRDEILKLVPPGPFTEKRNLRLTPDAVNRLSRLAGDTVEASVFIRQVFAYFSSIPEWTPLFGDNGRSTPYHRPGTASSSGKRAWTTQRPQGVLQGHPLAALLLLLMLLLPLLVMAVKALIGWLQHRGDRASPLSPEDGQGQPNVSSPP